MTTKFVFPLKGASCDSCGGVIRTTLNEENKPQFFSIKSITFSKNYQQLNIEIDDDKTSEAEVRRYISQTLAIDGGYELVAEASTRQYWLLGSLGLILGTLILVLTISNALVFWPFQLIVGIVSVGLTGILGRESWQKAKIEWQRKKPGMDSLFLLSTGAALGMSLVGLFVPGFPLMFEASLLIYGFRYIGIALKKSIYSTPNLPVRYQRIQGNSNKTVPNSELRPGDKLTIKAGELILTDGWLLPGHNTSFTQSYAMDVSRMKGSYSPEQLKTGDAVAAGMVATNDCVMQVGLGHSIQYFIEKPVGKCPKGQIWIYPEHEEIHVLSHSDQNNRSVSFKLSAKDLSDHAGHCYFDAILTALKLKTMSTHLPKVAQQQLSRALVQQAAQHGLTQTTSSLARLEKELEDAAARAAPIQEKADKILTYFVPIVFGIAVISGAIVAFFFSPLIAVRCMISILVSACPCTLGFVTPLVMDFARAKGKQAGVAFSQYDAIQRLSEVDSVLIDIHGTATKGKPEARIAVYDELRRQEIETQLARLEQFSDHHIAKAIYAKVKGNDLLRDTWRLQPADIETYSGGIGARIQGKHYILGNRNLLQQFGVVPAGDEPNKTYLLEQNGTHYQKIAEIDLHDELRLDTALAIQQFNNRGLDVYLLTGTDQKTAEKYAQNLPGLAGVFAGHSDPQAKANKVKSLQETGRRMLMIGDGVNDSLAMQEAYASLAMKHALSDEGAQYIAKARILNERMLTAVDAYDIADQAMWRVKINLGLSLVYNLAVVMLTNFLVLAMGIVLHPGFCAALMVIQVGFIILSTYYFKQQPLPTKSLLSHSSLFQPTLVGTETAYPVLNYVPR